MDMEPLAQPVTPLPPPASAVVVNPRARMKTLAIFREYATRDSALKFLKWAYSCSLSLIMLGLGCWSAWFIFRTSFNDQQGHRVFCLVDDAMITMTYARNLCDGWGLNWARFGQPVEGFTHPLWLGLMIVVNSFPLPLAQRSLVVQAASALLLLVNLWAVRRLWYRVVGYGDDSMSLSALLLTATYYPLNYWSLFGMETAAQALLTTLLATDVLDAQEGRAQHPWRLGVLGGCAYLLRMDMLILILVCAAMLLYFRRLQALLGLVLGTLGTAASYEVFRLAYFGDWLPNTYYLKLAGVPLGVRLLRGIDVFETFLWRHLVLFVLVGVSLFSAPRGQRRVLALPLMLASAAFAYSIYVGGDVWDYTVTQVFANRFTAFIMPLVFVLAMAWSRRGILRGMISLGITVTLIAGINGIFPWNAAPLQQWRILAGMEVPPQVYANQVVFAQWEHLRASVAPNSKVATFWAGIPAFFGDYKMVDILGFNDRHIAHLPPVYSLNGSNFRDFTPGHIKWDNEYLLTAVRPDAFFQTWAIPDDQIGALMRTHGYQELNGFWVRKR